MEFTPETFATIGIQADNLDSINAAIDALKEMKKAGKEAFAEQQKAAREAAKAEAVEAGKALVKDAKVGDIATVICGSGKFAKEYQFPIEKIGEATITVSYTEDNTPNGTTGVRYINFGKIVSIQPAA